MTNLRERVLRTLAGSSSQNPVPVERLRALSDDRGEIDGLLDQLFSSRAILRVSGTKNSKPFADYWLPGAAAPAAPFRVSTPAPPAEAQRPAAKPQPKTSIPAPTQEKPMSTNTPSDLRKELFELISKHPGVRQDALIVRAQLKFVDASEKQIKQTLSNMKFSKQISTEGERENPAYVANTSEKAPSAPKAKAAATKKTAKAKTPRNPAARAEQSPADPELQIALREDGHLVIAAGSGSVALSEHHIQRVAKFITRHSLA